MLKHGEKCKVRVDGGEIIEAKYSHAHGNKMHYLRSTSGEWLLAGRFTPKKSFNFNRVRFVGNAGVTE